MLEMLFGGNNYLLWMIPGVLLTLFGNFRLRRKFKKYGKMPNGSRITGKETARAILDSEDLQKVPVKAIKGSLTDHYDPGKNIVNLSQPIYGKTSIGAMAVGAHEVGHAIQDKDGYFMMKLRGWIVPLATIGTNFGYLLIAVGLIVGAANLARIGVLLFALTTLFALVTLPVEFDASKRAKKKLQELGLTKKDEDHDVDDMLAAAAFTYVAAFATSAIQLLFWSLTVRGELKEDDDEPAAAASEAAKPAAGKIATGDLAAPKGGLASKATADESTRESRRASGPAPAAKRPTIERSDDPDTAANRRLPRQKN